MKFILQVTVLLIAVAIMTCTSTTLPKTRIVEQTKPVIQEQKEVRHKKKTLTKKEIRTAYIIRMQTEILNLWNTWYDTENNWTKKKANKIKHKWPKWAMYIAQAVDKYEHIPIKYNEWNDNTITLPKDTGVHLVLASMAIHETKINNSLIGKLNEIGILQCHPKWCLVHIEELQNLRFHKRIEIAKTRSDWNIEAAVIHLAISYGICQSSIKEPEDWLGPVAHYVGGNNALDGKKCGSRWYARKRIKSINKYLHNS